MPDRSSDGVRSSPDPLGSSADVSLSFYDGSGNLVRQDQTSLTGLLTGLPFARVSNTLTGFDGDLQMVAETNANALGGVVFLFNQFR